MKLVRSTKSMETTPATRSRPHPYQGQKSRPKAVLGVLSVCFRWSSILPLALVLNTMSPLEAIAEQSDTSARAVSDREIMATYLFRLVNFYEWPEDQWPQEGNPVQACLFGNDPFRNSLDYFEGRIVRGLRFTSRRLASIQESEGCQLLFIGSSDRAKIRSTLFQLANRSVLTVGIGIDFVRLGGSVGFVFGDHKVGLAINPNASRSCGLEVSSKLVEVSYVVGGTEE